MLALVMGMRAKASGKFMPAGMVASLSLLMAILYVAELMSKPRGKAE
jgi:hypothetical protein